MTETYRIDCLQYANWSEKIFRQMREGQVDAVHVTIAYHETFREMVLNVEQWNVWFERFPDLIFHGRTGDDVRRAREGRRRGRRHGVHGVRRVFAGAFSSHWSPYGRVGVLNADP